MFCLYYFRNNLLELINIKKQSYFINKNGKESIEEYLKSFITDEIVPIWPPDWMTVDDIIKEYEEKYNNTLYIYFNG